MIHNLNFSAIHIIAMLYAPQMGITENITVLTLPGLIFVFMNLQKSSLNLIVLVNLNLTLANFHLQPFPVSFVSSFSFRIFFFLLFLFTKN